MTTAMQKIIEEVKALSPAERREVEAALRGGFAQGTAQSNEQEVAQRLAAQGTVTAAQRSPRPARPAPITGQPVSEIIIAERR